MHYFSSNDVVREGEQAIAFGAQTLTATSQRRWRENTAVIIYTSQPFEFGIALKEKKNNNNGGVVVDLVLFVFTSFA